MQIVDKPWGKEELLEINERYVLKRLTMYAGHRCSLQLHKNKHETIYLLSGMLKIFVGLSKCQLSENVYNAHDYIAILPNIIHRMEAIKTSVYLESSTPELNDIVRISDDYKRID